MARVFYLVVVVLLLGFGTLACAGNERTASVLPERTMEFTDPLQTINVAVGETFSIVLESNATTGYTWQKQEQPRDSFVIFMGGTYMAPRTNLAGAGGRQRLVFKAGAPGTEKLAFHYLRPWEKDTEPARSVVFTVVVR